MVDSITAEQLRVWLAEHEIDMVRVEGTNLDSALMGKVLSPAKAVGAVESGIGMVDLVFGADLDNTPQLGFAWPQWRGDMADIFLRPDLSTLTRWGPGQASVLGDFVDRWGNPLAVCPRNTLERICGRLAAHGYSARVAIEIEATVFEEDIHEARRKGFRDLTPLGGKAGFCYHMPKDARWHEYMTAVSRRFDEVGIPWDAWNDEAAWGQIELNISISDPVAACDYWTRARQVMREVAFELGRTVTFMAKWCDGYGQASHINLSLADGEDNAFYAEQGPSEVMRHFIGGVMQTVAPTTSLALPWITSYRRMRDFEGPPTTVTWGTGNKSTAIRAIVGHRAQSRIEYRVPGADSNAYLTVAAVLASGLHGISEQIEPPQPFDGMAYLLPPGVVDYLPDTIGKALAVLEDDTTLRTVLGDELIDYWIGLKRWEWMQYHTDGGGPDDPLTEWEFTRYFELV
ncbi:glutamine synthetase family protein [Rhodococcus sp. NPDC056960]|uniref:glutamine synthetase family protein n=1 Tax=Rhodococcus sp. NPDC056960 TaxID=3345982 RepID=UPI003636B629